MAFVVGEAWAPFIVAVPSFPFLFLISSGFHNWEIMDEVFGAATMVAAFLICLGILHHSG